MGMLYGGAPHNEYKGNRRRKGINLLKKIVEISMRYKSIGTRTNGTVKVAPPKFEAPKDLKVRQADFKD